MDPREMETLVSRLIANPHDEDALSRAHQAGQLDPQAYASLLERVAQGTTDPTFAAHWMSEAASVWETLGNADQQFRLLQSAVDRDPTNHAVVERLTDTLASRGQHQELARVLERSVDAWQAALHDDPEFRDHMLATHERLAQLYAEGPLAAPDSAFRHWAALCELDPQNVLAIYSARELLKSLGRHVDAVPYFAKEQALVDEPERKMALYRDEAETRRLAGDGQGRTEALRQAWRTQSDDPGITYEFGSSVVDRIDAGEAVSGADKQEAGQALLGLAEMYEGEHGMMYAVAALKAAPGDDRAMQLADFYAEQLGRMAELPDAFRAYLQATPDGFMAEKARTQLAALGEPAAAPAGASATPAPVELTGGISPSGAPAPAAQASEPPAAAVEASVGEAAIPQILAEASEEASRGRKPQAYGKYREVLNIEPANAEALSWVEDFLRQRRKFSDLRDVLLAASRVSTVSVETRKAQLRDVAGLCESKLRDFETAISAWKQICQIDRADTAAREQLCALLEKQKRWDELAPLLEQEAMNETDVETKISMEKKVAQLHEKRRKDPVAAAEAWVRVAELAPGDDGPVQTAVRLFEQGEDFDAAAGVIVDQIAQLDDIEQKASLLKRLAELRTKMDDTGGAGDAYAEAAELDQQDKTWEMSADCYRQCERWADVAQVVEQRALLQEGAAKAALLAEAAEALVEAGNSAAALVLFEQAGELDPASEEHAAKVETHYQAEGRQADIALLHLRRADALDSSDQRILLRHRAAQIQFSIGDEEGGCDSLRQVLADGEDRDALDQLHQAAERRADHMDAVDLLQRLVAVADGADKLGYALREAQIVAEGLNETDLAIDRYERVLQDIDADNRTALRAIGVLERRRNNPDKAAVVLERELKLADGEERIEISSQLAELYEGPLDDAEAAVRVLDIIHGADPQDFDAIARLQVLCEKLEDWPRVTALLSQLIEVEGDEEEASAMTRQLAELLHDKLSKGDEALGALERLADQGDVPCQHAYADLGIELNWKGLVAQKLVQWNQTVAGSSRAEALRRAFDLFVEAERDPDARAVALDLAGSRDLDHSLASSLEEIATRLRDLEAMAVAHDLLSADLSGSARADELVRQAEIMVSAGADAIDAITHGEQGLGGIEPVDAELLLERLAGLTGVVDDVLDLYERQVQRCRLPAERISALAHAARVAAERGALNRAREFFNAALSGGVQEETIATLETTARSGGEEADSRALLQTLAEALAGGGQGSRDGGRTRGSLLRRAAVIAHRELNDVDRAFAWLGDSIIAHVDESALDALAQLGSDVGDMDRVEAALTRALDEVFDGPLVRKLLRRRASVRREYSGDLKGAAADLKRLHDLSPADQHLTDELSGLLTELGDHRGMIELYEDQILRGREPTARAELARKVARIWEEELGDVREAADAWRRVLRMRSGDDEAKSALARAKSGKLKRAPRRSGSSPPAAASTPVPVEPTEALAQPTERMAPVSAPSAEGEVSAPSSATPSSVSPQAPASEPAVSTPASAPPEASQPAAPAEPPAEPPPLAPEPTAGAHEAAQAAGEPLAPHQPVGQADVGAQGAPPLPQDVPLSPSAEQAPQDVQAGQPPAVDGAVPPGAVGPDAAAGTWGSQPPPAPAPDGYAAQQPDPYAQQAGGYPQQPDPYAAQQQPDPYAAQQPDPYAQQAGGYPQQPDPYAQQGGWGSQPPPAQPADPYAAQQAGAYPQQPDPYAQQGGWGSQPPPAQGGAQPPALPGQGQPGQYPQQVAPGSQPPMGQGGAQPPALPGQYPPQAAPGSQPPPMPGQYPPQGAPGSQPPPMPGAQAPAVAGQAPYPSEPPAYDLSDEEALEEIELIDDDEVDGQGGGGG